MGDLLVEKTVIDRHQIPRIVYSHHLSIEVLASIGWRIWEVTGEKFDTRIVFQKVWVP